MLLWIATVQAASLQLQVERRELVEGQTMTAQLVLVDAAVAAPPEIAVPAGLQLRYAGQKVSSFINNFRSSQALIFSYELVALRPGNYTLGPVQVESSVGKLKAAAVSIQVSARSSSEKLVPSLGDGDSYEGQVRVYRLHFETSRPLVDTVWSPPEAVGFSPEAAVEPMQAKDSRVDGGTTLAIHDLYFPIRFGAAGKRVVPGGVLQARFALARSRQRQPFFGLDRFGDVQEEIFSAEPLPVVVKALPSEGRAADFSGFIGQLSITAAASATQISVGDTVTVEMTLRGNAPLAGIKLPPLQGSGFKVYDDQPVAQAKLVDGQIVATASYKRAVVAQQPGTLEIPSISLSYFDPISGQYRVVQTDSIPLNVSGTASTAQVASFAQAPAVATEVDVLGEDILPLRTAALPSSSPMGTWAWTLLIPGLALLLAELLPRLRPQPRVVEAGPVLSLDNLPAQPEARLAALDLIFRQAVAARLGTAEESLRREQLSGLGEQAAEAEQVYRALEAARYRGDSPDGLEASVRRIVGLLR